MVDNQQVEQMPSANLAVATHELSRLPPTPEVLKIQALLKAAQVQVNDIRNPAPSYSTATTRSRNPHSFAVMGGVVTKAARSSKGGPGAMLPSILDHKDHEINDQLITPTRRLINRAW